MFNYKIFLILFFFHISPISKGREEVKIIFSEAIHKVANFAVEEIENIYRKIGTDPKISIFPESRMTYLFERGEADALGMKVEIYNKINPSAIKIDIPLVRGLKFSLFALKSEYERVKKLKKPYIVTTKSCLGCLEFAKIHKIQPSSLLSSMEQVFKVLIAKRADLVIVPNVVVSRSKDSRFHRFDERVYSANYYHFIGAKKIHLKDKLEQEFARSSESQKFSLKKLKLYK
ncbi:hypothetical protein BIY24_04515 [Halobacteriovorax marinus]|uniref:hypothetical protein n=1 Tax=Halobacteriovorax marinus TaxID=97084 RepID=UPI000BC34F47|nr:hypothetical protein [Halobacteriovorax marinus]ATH07223.1 hypothetical protein BIY24_04515 [Halobacteriovorax marinus]